MIGKECNKCKDKKPIKSFSKNAGMPSGIRYQCKDCDNKDQYTYKGTKNGYLTKIYGQQIASSKKRGHPMPSYTREELGEWLFAQPNFDKLFNAWLDSGRDKNLAPSIDRDKNHLPYTFNNITLMTWQANKEKAEYDSRKGELITNNPHKTVIGKHKKTGKIVEFISASEASRKLGVSRNGISQCCNGNNRYSHAGGYKWEFKNSKQLIN